jgi:hypothetical protein
MLLLLRYAIIPIYNIKKESTFEDLVETLDNLYDHVNSNQIGDLKQRDSISKKNNRYKKKRDQIESIKDDDFRRKLSDGQTQLISYTES